MQRYERSHLLETAWTESISGLMVFEAVSDRNGLPDLKLLEANPASLRFVNHQLNVGDLLCETLPGHRGVIEGYGKPLINLFYEALEVPEGRTYEFRFDDDGITGHWLNISKPLGEGLLFMTFVEVTEQARRLEKQTKLANYDQLTGLLNIRGFEATESEKPWHSCIYLDLDEFKPINDMFGHEKGDELLVKVALALKRCAQHCKGRVIRMHGDEFCIFVPGDCDAEKLARQVINEVLEISIAAPNGGRSLSVGVSCGIASGDIQHPIFSELKTKTEVLQTAADYALLKAKEERAPNRHERIKVWEAAVSDRWLRERQTHDELLKAEVFKEFSLRFQPIVKAEGHVIVGCETLIRWESKHFGQWVSPAYFIPIVEKMRRMTDVSHWVIDETFAALQGVIGKGSNSNLFASINISPAELNDRNFPTYLHQQVEAFGIDPSNIVLEVTERGIKENLNEYLKTLENLRESRIELGVDDFGTGDSSLLQLLEFPFDEVKIDRALIPLDEQDYSRLKICEAIATLSETIGFSTVAEGIETQWQAGKMRELGIDLLQGYYFSKPLTLDAFKASLAI